MCIYIYIYVYVYVSMYEYICIYTHTYMRRGSLSEGVRHPDPERAVHLPHDRFTAPQQEFESNLSTYSKHLNLSAYYFNIYCIITIEVYFQDLIQTQSARCTCHATASLQRYQRYLWHASLQHSVFCYDSNVEIRISNGLQPRARGAPATQPLHLIWGIY